MRNSVRVGCAATLVAGILGIANAESLYTVSGDALKGTTLFGQQLNEPMLVTVKPSTESGFSGDSEVMAQCLWSVMVDFTVTPVSFTAGKMICVGPNQEVLETTPSGTIMSFGQCSDAECSNYLVAANETVVMNLAEPLEFNLQPRNERK